MCGCHDDCSSVMQLYHENEKLRQEIKRLRKESSDMDHERGLLDSECWGWERVRGRGGGSEGGREDGENHEYLQSITFLGTNGNSTRQL